jgi:hypothetical protein
MERKITKDKAKKEMERKWNLRTLRDTGHCSKK